MTHETRHIVLSEQTTAAVRVVVEQWVGLLVERKYAEALALLATRRPTTWVSKRDRKSERTSNLVTNPEPDSFTFHRSAISTAYSSLHTG